MDKPNDADKPLYLHKPSAHPIRLMQLWAALWLILCIVFFLFVVQTSKSLWCLLPIAIVNGIIAIYILWINTTQQSFAIYEDGLEYRVRNSRIFSRWEDLQGFETRGTRRRYVFGISTAKLEKQYGWNIFERLYFGNEYHDFIPFEIGKLPTRIINPQEFQKTTVGYIPLPDNSELIVDTAKFAETKFGRELMYHAPHLFEYGKEKAKNG